MANGIDSEQKHYSVLNLNAGTEVAGHVVVAGTSAARKKGLLGVNGLQNGAGLWIAPCEAIHTVGMKMPIDVIFLDRELRVCKLASGVRPWRVSISLKAHSVLELEAGAIPRSNTHIGDRLRFQAA
ncbi:MAG: DUF192 domain-containing protein [Acidobacteriota bacterium]|nr:DUF192 domain-containing protein [Acidobacteriota bacterium]